MEVLSFGEDSCALEIINAFWLRRSLHEKYCEDFEIFQKQKLNSSQILVLLLTSATKLQAPKRIQHS